MNVLHGYIGDLVIDVSHNGTTVRLITHVPSGFGEDCDSIHTVFDDEGGSWSGTCPHSGCTRPYDPSMCGDHLLAAFNGMSADGDWVLRIADTENADIGTLVDWSLCFNAPDPPLVCHNCPDGTVTSGPWNWRFPMLRAAIVAAGRVGSPTRLQFRPAADVVADVNVGLNLSHTYVERPGAGHHP